nr:helix-turn-helix domain-containing protein [uncultured Adlercreutzia sp.]
MSIILKVGELMDGRGLDDEGLARLMGLEIEGARKLREGDVGAIRFSTLNGLCLALGCGPGDVLGYVPDGDEGAGRGTSRIPAASDRMRCTGSIHLED